MHRADVKDTHGDNKKINLFLKELNLVNFIDV